MRGGFPAVFLDRDGVLNDVVLVEGRPHPPPSLADLHIARGASDALACLAERGFVLVGVTNQPDVARGAQRREVVEAINAALMAALPLRAILTCYHDDADDCPCRKPRPGLLLEAAIRYSLDVSTSYMIGDRWKDVEAGQRAGCWTILIGDGYAESPGERPPDSVAPNLGQAASWILSRFEWSNAGGNG